ncbi:TolC family protein [uncultured Alistipes sp.]|uniref:TolC family protein n=1 Tax=uncultured Alistipes sp. TaxID=538949 RepID=UPI0025D99A7A|nr:TolC family protein [uncultured Alistipes sp.]
MKKVVITLWALLIAAAAAAQTEPTAPEFEYSDLQQLAPEDYINLQLPPLHTLMENARHAPQVGYYESNREIEERELKTVRRNWMHYFKLNANYNYGSSDIYNQNYQDSSIPVWTTTTTGRDQSWWNVGASFSIPIDELFNRRNKIKQQKKRIENTQYDMDRWYDDLRLKIIDSYTSAVQQLSILRSAAEAMIAAQAQYRMSEADFVNGKLDAQALSRQKSIENVAIREYEQVRSNLNNALLRLEVLTHTPIINKSAKPAK